MEIIYVVILVIFFISLLYKPNRKLTEAVLEWPSLSKTEKRVYVTMVWLLPGVGHYIAYKKSGLDGRVKLQDGTYINTQNSTDAGSSGGDCGGGEC